jgi:hypothetical protein
MRKSLVLAALVLIILFANAQDNLQRGLVAYYPFNDNTNDESENGNNGTKSGDIVYVEGKFGKAAKFGGYSKPGHIRVPNSSSLKFNSEATFTMWVKLDDASGMDGWGRNSATGNHCLFAKDHDRSGIVCTLSYNQNKLSTGLGGYEGVTGGGSCSTYNNGISGYSIGNWVHIVYICDATENTLFINGEKNNSIAKPFNFGNTNTRDLYFGKFSDSWYPFNGVLDEIRIYNRALNANEVSQLYNNDNSFLETKSENNEPGPTTAETVKVYDNHPIIQNSLKFKLPENKYNDGSDTRYAKICDFLNSKRVSLYYHNFAQNSFLNTEFISNFNDEHFEDIFVGYMISGRINIAPILIDIAYFNDQYVIDPNIGWARGFFTHSGIKLSTSVPIFPITKYLLPYAGIGYQISNISGSLNYGELGTYNNVLAHEEFSTSNTSSPFWKIGIQSYLLNYFPIIIEYSQTFNNKNRNFNQFSVGIGLSF